MTTDADRGGPRAPWAEGVRLTGVLTVEPVAARGVLDDGRHWTLRSGPSPGDAGRGGSSGVRRMVLAVDEGHGHALGSLVIASDSGDGPGRAGAGDVAGAGLVVSSLSVPAGANTRILAVAAGPRVRWVAWRCDGSQIGPADGDDGGTGSGVALYRDSGTGWTVHLIRVGAAHGGGWVVGDDAGGVERVAVPVGAPGGATSPPLLGPDVPPRLGAIFVAATGLVGVVAVLLAGLVGPSPAGRVAVAACGVAAIAVPVARLRWARHRGDPPAGKRHPVHAVIGYALANAVLLGCVPWALDPSGSIIWSIVAGPMLVAAVVTVVELRGRRPRS